MTSTPYDGGNWTGEMDNFRVYNYVLSNAQVAGLYASDLLPTVTIAATTPHAYESGAQNGVFTVARSGSTASAITVNYSIGGTAATGVNYATIASSVTIPSGQSSAAIDIAPVQGLADGDQTVVLTLASGTGYTLYSSPTTATVLVSDNSLCPTVSSGGHDPHGPGEGLRAGRLYGQPGPAPLRAP